MSAALNLEALGNVLSLKSIKGYMEHHNCKIFTSHKNSVANLRIRDVYPKSWIGSRIQGQKDSESRSGSASRNLIFLTQKIVSKNLLEI
jgi:hypothetical protein